MMSLVSPMIDTVLPAHHPAIPFYPPNQKGGDFPEQHHSGRDGIYYLKRRMIS
jgi:hypothetical protein